MESKESNSINVNHAQSSLHSEEILILLRRSKRFYEDIVEAFKKEICAVESGHRRTTTALYSAELISKTNRILCLAEKNQIMHSRHLRASILSLPRKQETPINSSADVSVTFDADANLLLVYMPYMPTRYNNGQTIVNEVLSIKLDQCEKLPSWDYWRADFYHVYPTSLSSIPKDVDNYNYKRTIDLLAMALSTTDNAARFSMSAQSIFEDSIPSGTYVEISQKSSTFPDFPKSFHRLFA